MSTTNSRLWLPGLAVVTAAYLHHALPYLTMMPRVNVDEPWLIERAYQVLHSGLPRQPMLGLNHAYLLQPGYGYLVAPWIGMFGVGIFQARVLAVLLGLGAVLAIAGVGRRLAGESAGLFAAAYLLSDSNFLGGARMARTDMPAVFFIALAFLLFLIGRDTNRPSWYAASGASTAAAILCHGNSFWAAAILGVWYAIDHGRMMFKRSQGYAYAAGLLLALAPYLAVVALNRQELGVQIASFAADRVPGWKPSFLLEQIRLEPLRYRDWYFGLVTDTVRNPVLRVFQIAIVAGLAYVLFAALTTRDGEGRRRMWMVFVWAAGAAVIFAALINNKALVYMPHLLLGFAVAAGVVTAWSCGVVAAIAKSPRVSAGAVVFVLLCAHATAATAYYQKWYVLTNKSALLPYESTARTVARLVPQGPKYVYAAPQFWIPFAEEPGVTFFSHAAPAPAGPPDRLWPEWASDGRPLFLVLDEVQWEPELVAPAGGRDWQRAWITFIERSCALRAYAPGTAYGTLAAYECARNGVHEAPVRVVSDSTEYAIGPVVSTDGSSAAAAWKTSDDPKFPGVERAMSLTPGQPYLLTAEAPASTSNLVYIGRWTPSEVTSLSGGASGGIVEPAARPGWFPGGHAFMAQVPSVRVLFYAEPPAPRYPVTRVEVSALTPIAR